MKKVDTPKVTKKDVDALTEEEAVRFFNALLTCDFEFRCVLQRILIAGKATVTAEAAEVFATSGIKLLGNEGQTVGPEDAPMQVHLILLGKGIALLEGIVLKDVPEGRYFLSAAPLNLGGADGSPCRAYLIDREES